MSAPRSLNDLDTPIIIYQRTVGRDAAGSPTEDWDILAFSTYAREDTASAIESERADQVASFTRVVFWIRFRAGMTNTMRVRRNGQLFSVVAVDAFGRREWQRLVCERLNDG